VADFVKSFFLSPEAGSYLVDHSRPQDDVLADLIEETQREVGGLHVMQIAVEQGAFMQLLAGAIGAKRAVEVGTFTGYSSICIARGLPEDGHLLCLDTSEEWTAFARRAWKRAGLEHKIELLVAPALDSLRALPEDDLFDLAFIDADKVNYAVYYDEILKRMPPGGLIVCDNVLWGGSVLDAERQDEQTVAIREFNDKVAADARVETSMIAVGDGLLLAR
jgi:caffeoyl-CoA O-methyltransferase